MPTNYCGNPKIDACELVINGDFEQYSELPSSISQLNNACNWNDVRTATADYFHSSVICTPSTIFCMRVPSNFIGYQTVFNGVGNAYAGMDYISFPGLRCH